MSKENTAMALTFLLLCFIGSLFLVEPILGGDYIMLLGIWALSFVGIFALIATFAMTYTGIYWILGFFTKNRRVS